MVPVSIREAEEHGALGNRISAMMAPLPVWCEDPVERLHVVTEAMGDLKASGQAVGAEILTRLTDFAPTTIVSQAARLQPAQRFFNLVVTNVPGPQFPLYVLGRQMESIFPMVPLAQKQALCIGIVSYNGQVNFGLIGDYDAMPDLASFKLDLEAATEEAIATAPPAPAAKAATRGGPQQRRRGAELTPRSAGSRQPTTSPLIVERLVVAGVVPGTFDRVEAVGLGVGVDDDGGDPPEAARVREPGDQFAALFAVVDRFDRPAVAPGADAPDQRQPRRDPFRRLDVDFDRAPFHRGHPDQRERRVVQAPGPRRSVERQRPLPRQVGVEVALAEAGPGPPLGDVGGEAGEFVAEGRAAGGAERRLRRRRPRTPCGCAAAASSQASRMIGRP